MFLTTAERDRFDRVLERVLLELPETARHLIQDVPLIVEDQPDAETLEQMQIQQPEDLCGLYAAAEDGEEGSEEIVLYRLGLWVAARGKRKTVEEVALDREIRLTLAQQLGGLFQLGEDMRRKIAGL